MFKILAFFLMSILLSCGKSYNDRLANVPLPPGDKKAKVGLIREIYEKDEFLEKTKLVNRISADIEIMQSYSIISAYTKSTGDTHSKHCHLIIKKNLDDTNYENIQRTQADSVWSEAENIVNEEKLAEKANVTDPDKFDQNTDDYKLHSYFKLEFLDGSSIRFFNESEKWAKLRGKLIEACFREGDLE